MKEVLNIYCSNCNAITEHRQKGLRDTVNVCNICDTTNSAVGFSCVLDPQYVAYTWLTTPIKEIESDTVNGNIRTIVFKTQNSSYKLYIVKNESNTY